MSSFNVGHSPPHCLPTRKEHIVKNFFVSMFVALGLWLCVNTALTPTFAQTSSGKGECKRIQTIEQHYDCHQNWPYPCSGTCNWVNYFDDHCQWNNWYTDCATVGTPTQDTFYPVPCMSDCSCNPNEPDWGSGGVTYNPTRYHCAQ